MARKWLVDPGQAINLRIEWGTFERWEGKQIMKSNQTFLYVGAALCALTGSMPAMAQDAASTTGNDIIVTGSRIQRGGFDLPTPTTVVGEEELRLGDRPSIAQALNDIPQFRPSATPATTTGNTNAAASSADLRGLGSGRTLTLLNGHRFTGSNDLNIIPQNIVKRVDIVTGGASAAWGSGAVAGVVNIILDDDLTGWKAGLNTGISSRGDGHRYGGDLSWGTDFADEPRSLHDRRRVSQEKGAFDRKIARTSMPRACSSGADGQLILPNDVNYTIINTRRLGAEHRRWCRTTSRSIRTDRSARCRSAARTFGQLTVGGNGQHACMTISSVSTPYERDQRLRAGELRDSATRTEGVGGWQLTTAITGGLSASSRTRRSLWSCRQCLPDADAKSQLAAAGVNYPFVLGRILDDVGPDNGSYYSYKSARRNIEGAFGLDGSFGGGWKYSLYLQSWRAAERSDVYNQRITANFNRAIDAVLVQRRRDPAG
jgi:iron complex outermembrane receptor protein